VGLQSELGFRQPHAGTVQRLVQEVASVPAVAAALGLVVPQLDAKLLEATTGRRSLTGPLGGLPLVALTTTGRCSGQARTAAVIGVPLGAQLAVVGANFGRPTPPAWALNLAADARATVAWGGRRVAVLARPVDGSEADAAWDIAGRLFAGFPRYARRAGAHRDVPVFALYTQAMGSEVGIRFG
jgi:deazaflavin-dependent oxidoreductase (nitroreductase family)